jgi:hypothetical protein
VTITKELVVGREFVAVLEYDGENPIRNDFICVIDDLNYSYLRDWEDLYGNNVLTKISSKKHSLKTSKRSKYHGCFSWGVNEIIPQIEKIKKEIKLDIELDAHDKDLLQKIISNLQYLYDLIMEKCSQNNLEPEKCYLAWWIDQ